LPDLSAYFAFLAAVLLMQAAPGPDTILVAVRGMGQGRAVAFCTVFGMTVLAGLVQLPLLAFGLGAVARAFPPVFDVIRLAGAASSSWSDPAARAQRWGPTHHRPGAPCSRAWSSISPTPIR
jgi:threonine/homoserine/homoserine lactone efflux protein